MKKRLHRQVKPMRSQLSVKGILATDALVLTTDAFILKLLNPILNLS
ncbi:MAG: hypothetical protein WBA41_18680 [Rivularia sp. (in: cyanobacteria)]